MPIVFVTNKAGKRTLVRGLATSMELKAEKSWRACRNRCRRTVMSANEPTLKCYHSKNISVCERWQNSFENFFSDMGPPPSEIHSLERKNGNLGYSPENCVWATPEEQANNRSSTHWITIDGETKTLSQWSRASGVKIPTLLRRIMRGTTGRALIQPTGRMQWRSMKMLTIDGRTQCQSAWAREIGISQEGLAHRLKQGISGMDLFKRGKIGRPTNFPPMGPLPH